MTLFYGVGGGGDGNIEAAVNAGASFEVWVSLFERRQRSRGWRS